MSCRLLHVGDHRWTELLAQADHDFYHLPSYVALSAHHEGGTACALYMEQGATRMLLPLIVRPIEGGGCDATSPYGYPGPVMTTPYDPVFVRDALAEGVRLLAAQGIVSLFVRLHPILNASPPIGVGKLVQHGETVSIDVTRPLDVLWSETRKDHRYQIKKALRAGHQARIDTDFQHFGTFKRLYRETMSRVGADPYYFFDDDYFDGMREALGVRLYLGIVEIEGVAAATNLFVETCGIVQGHLAATDQRYAKHAPAKLLIQYMRDWAHERGDHWLHLGGGLGAANDSLLTFKAGFSPGRSAFHTIRVVVRPREYERLVAGRDGSADPTDLDGFFPLYRCR